MSTKSWADIEEEEELKSSKTKKKNLDKRYHKDIIYLNNKWIRTRNLTKETRESSQLN